MFKNEDELIDDYMLKVAVKRKNDECTIDLADVIEEFGLDANEIDKLIEEDDE